MIVYQKTKGEFRADVATNDIENIIAALVLKNIGRKTSRSEMDSWRNSLGYMDRVLRDTPVPDDCGVAIEYQTPQANLRIDFVLTGQDDAGADQAIIIELKQWSETTATDMDGIVKTRYASGLHKANHPSYQAWSYAAYLQGFSEVVYTQAIYLHPCAYLHNHEDDGVLTTGHYAGYVAKAPLFLKRDAAKLGAFISQHVTRGDATGIMYRIESGRIRPSKQLADVLVSMIKGNQEFILLNEQKLVFEIASRIAGKASDDQKHVLIVRGGPGTGKSVVAIKLLVELTKQGLLAKYVTRAAAPRDVYRSLLTGSMKNSEFNFLFAGSGTFTTTEANLFDALIIDEAHRLTEKSGLFSKGENQVKEVINSARFSIFFLDEDQRVTVKDIGSEAEIEKWANQLGAQVHKLELESQFRCNGSNAYMAWLDDVLAIRETANPTLAGTDYEFQVVDTPDELQQLIFEKNKERNRARMVAGYCWDWVSKKDKKAFDLDLSPTFRHQWNLTDDGFLWIMKEGSVNEIGCIHTCQGLEVDYMGVIIGPDLVIRNGEVVTNSMARAGADKTVHGKKELLKSAEGRALLDLVIKNTYRTLMTRAMKGCYVYCTDQETAAYLRKRINSPL